MRSSPFEFVGNLDTAIAVVIGAVLATVGGLVAEHFEDQIERKRRERDAAKFFGEILASIDALVDRAIESQKVGDPWGPVTQRLFRTARREAEVYERNRERLFDLHDTALRGRVHSHVVSELFPLEALVEGCERIEEVADDLEDRTDLSPERRAKLEVKLSELKALRDGGLEFIKYERAQTPEIRAALERIAGVTFVEAELASAAAVRDAGISG